jgi:hypothetical protein
LSHGKRTQQLVAGERGIAPFSTSFIGRGLIAARPRHLNSDVMRLHDSMIVDKALYFSATFALMGSIVFLVAVYLFVSRVVFLAQAISLSAPIVSVSHGHVSKGKGSVLAYVPTVQVTDRAGRTRDLKVDTFNEEPIYSVGTQMRVSCNPQHDCIEDTFFSKWGDSLLAFLIGLAFLSPLAVLKLMRSKANGNLAT